MLEVATYEESRSIAWKHRHSEPHRSFIRLFPLEVLALEGGLHLLNIRPQQLVQNRQLLRITEQPLLAEHVILAVLVGPKEVVQLHRPMPQGVDDHFAFERHIGEVVA